MKDLSKVKTEMLEAQLDACADMRLFYEKDEEDSYISCKFCKAAEESADGNPICNNCPWTWFRVKIKSRTRRCLCNYYILNELGVDSYDLKYEYGPEISSARKARVKEITVWMEKISEELAKRYGR